MPIADFHVKPSMLLPALVMALTLFAVPATAQQDPSLFGSQQPLEVEIEAPWGKLIRRKSEQRWPATLTFTDGAEQTRALALTVERRGISRQRVCDFPPIRLRFDKESVEGTIFEGEGALKLVTHCDEGERWTQYYVLEMLAYRIYNLISDYSFRVRPLEVRYRDANRKREPRSHFAFLIEDIDEVADRHDLQELEFDRVMPSRLEPTTASQVALFQLMIGNLDWSALTGPDNTCCHNAKMIGSSPDAEQVIPIPYDFDVSGFVDTHYAVPPEKLPVRTVRTRLYRGFCVHKETLPAARRQILGLEADIMAVVRDEPRLNARSRGNALDYLGEYFEILRSDDRFEESVTSECRG